MGGTLKTKEQIEKMEMKAAVKKDCGSCFGAGEVGEVWSHPGLSHLNPTVSHSVVRTSNTTLSRTNFYQNQLATLTPSLSFLRRLTHVFSLPCHSVATPATTYAMLTRRKDGLSPHRTTSSWLMPINPVPKPANRAVLTRMAKPCFQQCVQEGVQEGLKAGLGCMIHGNIELAKVGPVPIKRENICMPCSRGAAVSHHSLSSQ